MVPFLKNIIVFIIFLPICATAQKVTLVMSGGGAKGLAHIGVIKALEEENIPIDYVVGTSMGGVVAGCYAAGISAVEIEEIVTSSAFLRWVNGELEPGYNYYFHRDDPKPSILDVQFSLDSAFRANFSSSIASDLSLNFALAETFAQPAASANYNFDSLFVPLRIVASDIFTQTEVILDSGSLSSAVRTSLSVPFFYKPIRIEKKYLFDGGIYNNFPVDVAQNEFDSDIIIGVNVSSKVFEEYPYDQDDKLLNSSLLFMLLDKSDPSKLPRNSIYLEPNLAGYTAFDFKRAQSLIDSGYVHTKRLMPQIKERINARTDEKEREMLRAEFLKKSKPYYFSGIDYEGFNSRQRRYINKAFGIDKKDSLSFEEIKKGYFQLVSEPYFSTIYPDIKLAPSADNYRLKIYGRPQSNLNVKLGGVIASRNISQVYLGVEHYHFDNYLLRTSLNFFAGNFYKSGQLKTRLLLSGTRPFYVEPELTYNDWNFLDNDDIFVKNKAPTILERIDRRYGLNFGFPIKSKLRGIVHGSFFNNRDRYAVSSQITAGDTLDFLKLTGFRAGLLLKHSDLNRKQYPNLGKSIKLEFDYFNFKEYYVPGSTSEIENDVTDYHNFFRVKVAAEQYFRYGKYSTGYLFEGVLSNQPNLSNPAGSLVNAPAFEPLNDSRTLFLQNFVGYNYLAGGMRNVFTLTDMLEFRLEGYLFKSFDGFRDVSDQLPSSPDFNNFFSFAATAGVVLHSPLGPVSLSANYYDDEENQFGVLLHVGYLLFNQRSWD